ncbi:PKD domain-containing protein [Flammeovirga agarivorans]|uniref:PKD domain-containing protein n=1 Tax=Flammeovirga agarivorans TaxID=2726742 RepID=A0A7X8SJP0_9BACT|nr:PKD domain-containing protein [Flammeovirga agarivorans]NLR91357.1 PKD domain-containing protein [Flammeovirga agarivorans]
MKHILYFIVGVLSIFAFSCSKDEPQANLPAKAQATLSGIDHNALELVLENRSENPPAEVDYKWNWGDSEEFTSDNNINVSHTYETPGEYIVTLKMIDIAIDQEVSSVTYDVTIGEEVNENGIQIQFNQLEAGAWDYSLNWEYVQGSEPNHVKEMYVSLATDEAFTQLLNPLRGIEIGAIGEEVKVEPSQGFDVNNLASESTYYFKIRFVDIYDQPSEYTVELNTRKVEKPTIRLENTTNMVRVFVQSNNLVNKLNKDFNEIIVTPSIDLELFEKSEDGLSLTYYKNIQETIIFDVEEQAYNRATVEKATSSDGIPTGSKSLYFSQSENGPLTETSKVSSFVEGDKRFIYIGDEENNSATSAVGIYFELNESSIKKGEVIALNSSNTFVVTDETNGAQISLEANPDGIESFGLRIIEEEENTFDAAVESTSNENGKNHLLYFSQQDIAPNVEVMINQLIFQVNK